MLIVILLCYTGGRLHQWARQSMDRDEAYREGYDSATKSMFFLATRVSSKLNRDAPLPMTREMPVPVLERRRIESQPRLQPLPPVVPARRASAGEPKRRGARHAA